jgi:membrane protein
MSTDEATASTAANPAGTGDPPAVTVAEETGVTERRRLLELELRLVHEKQRLIEAESRVIHRVSASTPGQFWSRLNAVDFMNSSMQFAALGVLCFFPLFIVAFTGVGQDGRLALIERLGLDKQAAKDLNSLISPGTHAVATLGVVGGAVVVLGAVGVASTLQTWYQRVYDLPPAKRWLRQMTDRLLWLASVLFYLGLQGFVGRELGHTAARVPVYAVTFVIAVAFFCWTVHVMLCGRIGWRQSFPAGLATGICATGLSVVSALFL